jgi:hypothetical protein
MNEPAPAQLVFLGGCPRSGLTLLRRLLDAHPDIHCGSDSGIAPGVCMQWRDFADRLGGLHARDFGLSAEAVRTQMAELLAGLLTPEGARIVCEKTSVNVVAFTELARLLPEAKFVHVVRDGRDVAASLLERDWRDGHGRRFPHVSDPDRALLYWAEFVRRGVEAETAIVADRILRVRYEDLVRRPRRTLKRLTGFIGAPMREEMLAAPPREMELVGAERDSLPLLRQPITTKRTGRAPAALTARAGGLAPVAAALRALGYADSATLPGRR